MMKRMSVSARKATTVVITVVAVVTIIGGVFTRSASPYEFEVVSVTSNADENMNVTLRFTNHSDKECKVGLTNGGLMSVSYIPVSEPVPTSQPTRLFSFGGANFWSEKIVPPNGGVVEITDEEAIRKSGDMFVAMWQPPGKTDWFSNLRRRIRIEMIGYPINLSGLPPASMSWRERIAWWIDPDPPKSLISGPFTVP